MAERSVLDQRLCFAVYSTAHAFNRAYRPLLAELGLTYPQYLAMLVLWERDGRTVKELGERLLLDSGTLTPLLKRLEMAGLVERRRNRDDERQVIVHLSPEGKALQARAAHIPEALACAVALPRAEMDRLLAELLALRGSLREAGDVETADG